MFPRLRLTVCVLGFAAGCAAGQIDAEPGGFGSGNATSHAGSAGLSQGGVSQGMAGSGSSLPSAGTTGALGGAGNGGGAGKSSTGTAGSSTAGSANGGAGGGAGSSNGAAGMTGSAGSSPGGTKLPFSEDFEDGAAQNFVPFSDKGGAGKWEVVTDGASKVYQPAAALAQLEFAVGGSTTWTDVAVSVRVKLKDADSGANIAIRFKDAKTYLVLEMAEGKYKLRGRANGSTTDLISPSPKPVITAGTWYTVGMTAKGTTATLTLDGKQIGSPAMCNAAISNGGVALGVDSGSASFDDLKVTAAP